MIIQIFILLDYLGGDKIIPLNLSKLSGGTYLSTIIPLSVIINIENLH
jgi:hypothetical protein